MNRTEFSRLLGERPLLLDGAMGTMLHQRGAPLDQSFENINRSDPALVAEIHRQYIDAGADIIEVNSFGANRYKLAEFGLQEHVISINEAGIDIARRVVESAFRPVLVAGSIGPLGVRLAPLGRVRMSQAQAAFSEQIGALLAGGPRGADLLIIETISDVKEVEAAVAAARLISSDIPIVASMTFTRDDRTLLGNTADDVARQLSRMDVDVIGVNCSGGPAQLLRLLALMRQAAPERLLAAVPNAGWPEQSEGGRVMYPATPTYFGEYAIALREAGAMLLGGCCGTTESHIAAMRRALDSPGPSRIRLPAVQVTARDAAMPSLASQPTRLHQYLDQGRFVATVEMSPPKGIATERLLAGARMLKEAGATFLNIADSPLARMRMSAWAAAHLVQKGVGLETILHFPTRGRNLLRIQGDLLAAYAMGIRNLFVAMGDPTRIGDYPEATDSYDIVPTGLIQMITRQFNRGLDKAGQSIGEATNFVVGCALNLTPRDPAREMALLRKKHLNGAAFALTQPVFDPAAALGFIEAYEAQYGAPIMPLIVGIKPLYNSRNAEFLHNEVPGIQIPDLLRQRMRQAREPQLEGTRIAQELLQEMRPVAAGVYLMPAFSRYDLVADVLDVLPAL